MRKEKIQQTVINKLLDKYEKSKTFTGTNQVNQSFGRKVAELFPKYKDDAEYEVFCEINEALDDLRSLGLVNLLMKHGEIIDTVSLNVERLENCYEFTGREPKREEHQWLVNVMDAFSGHAVLDAYFQVQRTKIAKNQKVEYFDGDKQEYADLLKLVQALLNNEEEMFVRDLSVVLFKDSKRVERLESKARALLYQYGEYLEKDSVLEECNVLKTPTYVSVKGQALVCLGGQKIDLSRLKGDIALSTASLKELKEILVTGNRVVTVENLTSFHDYSCENDFVIYLGGFHNRVKRDFLKLVYEQNPDKEYRHFGDIDAGGFYILEHLKSKTGIPFKSMYMDKDTLVKYMDQTKVLTVNDRRRIESLLSKVEKDIEDYREVLEFMLEKGCKLEQEVIRL